MSPDEEQLYRSLVVEFGDVAVNGTTGRLRDDPVAQRITEGHGGSSCGFLLHAASEVIGIREPWVNRNLGENTYRIGQNLSLLFGATWGGHGPKCAKRVDRGQLFKHGDFLIMGNPAIENDEHVCICAKDFDGDVLLSYDGGQRGAEGKREDFRFCERSMRLVNGKWTTQGGKQIWGCISLPKLVDEARRNGKLVEPTDPREWLKAVA